MSSIHYLLSNTLIALFAIIGIGLLFGNFKIKGISLGSSGVLFAALVAGHFGYGLPEGVGKIGLVLFVYCVGIGAGGRFFGALVNEGSTLAKLALFIVIIGAVLTWAFSSFLDIPASLAAGIFAGALTSTPALAAATESSSEIAQNVVIGYGIAYPFGVIGVVLFIQILPKLLKTNLDDLAKKYEQKNTQGEIVDKILVEVTNKNLFGKNISELGIMKTGVFQVTRVLRAERLEPLAYDDTFSGNQHVLIVGRRKDMELAIDYLGKKSNRPYVLDVENEREQLVITEKSLRGKTLNELGPLKHHGVNITRITRLGITFIPTRQTKLDVNDMLTVVGRSEKIKTFSEVIKHRSQAFDETDLLSISAGLTLGVIVGLIPIGLPGGNAISLGLAGGPLFVALLLGHFGRVGVIIGHIPRPTRVLLQELGLVLFLADAGIKGGSSLVATITERGPMLFIMGMTITLIPMLLAFLLSKRLFKINILQALGGICGGMTSTPALGAITAKTESQIPVVSYATAYPVALILMTIVTKILLGVLV